MHNTVQIMHYDVQLLINCTIDINFLLNKEERMNYSWLKRRRPESFLIQAF
jgi:hypothetical protein